VEGADGIVGKPPILGDQRRDESVTPLRKKAVVSDTQSEHDVQLAAGPIEQFGL
jgi:hypothetical protein